MWRASDRGSPHKARLHASTPLPHAVYASDGRVRLCRGCAGGEAGGTERRVPWAHAALGESIYHGQQFKAPELPWAAAFRRGTSRHHHAPPEGQPVQMASNIDAAAAQIDDCGLSAGGDGGRGPWASYPVTGANGRRRAGPWRAASHGSGKSAQSRSVRDSARSKRDYFGMSVCMQPLWATS